MAKTVSISKVKRDFLKRIESNESLVSISKSHQNSRGVGLKQKHIEQIMGLAFMSIIAAWEDFLEGCMVRYLKGRINNPSHVIKSKIGELSDLNLAYKILGGYSFDKSRDYLKFTNLKDVKAMADIFFKEHPFHPTQQEILLLKYMSTVRNRIAHNSEKSRTEFNKVSKKLLSLKTDQPLPQGWSVGVLLSKSPTTPMFTRDQVNDFKKKNITNNFTALIEILKQLADKFAPVI